MQLSSNGFQFKTKRSAFGFSSFITLFLFGLVFASVGVTILRSMTIDKSWVIVQGEVVDVSSRISDGSTLYTPIIAYTVDGTTHRVTGNSSSGMYPTIGSSREVAYNPARPDQAKAKEGAGTNILLGAIILFGTSLMLLAPVLYIKGRGRTAEINRLIHSGHKLQGVLVDLQDGNNNGYRIVVAATDLSGAVQHYVSDSLQGAAGLAMADFQSNPIPIDVYIDPTDPSKYYVDISDIPNLSAGRIAELIQQAASKQTGKTAGATPFNPAPVPVIPTVQQPSEQSTDNFYKQ